MLQYLIILLIAGASAEKLLLKEANHTSKISTEKPQIAKKLFSKEANLTSEISTEKAQLVEKFECPTTNGSYPDSVQCDKFYVCKDGNATTELCADGLVFNMNSTSWDKSFGKCDQPFNVECGKRTKMQEPQPASKYCPRRNGVFAHPDDTICDIFFICDDGEHSETPCANGLHFEQVTGQCTWPNVVNRENCVDQAAKRKLKDGFQCPNEINLQNKLGQVIVNPHYPHPEDCQYFYICVNGVEARELKCEEGLVYNDEKKTCTEPEDVPGCEDWFD